MTPHTWTMILVWNKLNNLFWTVVKNSRNFASSQHSTRKTIYLRFSQKMSKILDKKAICDDFSRRKNPPKKVYKKRCDVVKWNERIEKSWSTLYNQNKLLQLSECNEFYFSVQSTFETKGWLFKNFLPFRFENCRPLKHFRHFCEMEFV